MQTAEHDRLAARFERFAGESAGQGSSFYSRLSRHISASEPLLEIARHAPRESVPNAFLGAVHCLLLRGAEHGLREYYPSVTEQPRDDPGLFEAFSDFCLSFRREIIAVLSERLVQTNEVNRSAVLAPAFSVVHREAAGRPLALVEIGAGAGLNLLWDRYRIGYSDGVACGERDSRVRMKCELKGLALPAELSDTPAIGYRVGVDLNPIDLSDANERNWLRALVWPDHRERARRLDAAVAVALEAGPPPVLRGDALNVMPAALAAVPQELAACVFNSSVLYLFSPDERRRLEELLGVASARRTVWHVSAESEEGLWLFRYGDGSLEDKRRLAEFDAHGRWLRWIE